MLVWLSVMWTLHWGCMIGILGLTGAVFLVGNQQRLHEKERRRDRRIREEFEAYARLDVRLHGDDMRELAKQVCRLVAKRSAFQRVAMLAQDAEGRMYVAGSIGMEEITIQALHAWGERVMKESAEKNTPEDHGGIRIGEKSFAIVLGKDSADAGCGRAVMVPLWTSGGQMRGALAVCADRLLTLRRQTVEEAISPLETLALKMGRELENAALGERLLQAEKLTGVELLANGVAQELSNPLTAVLGFAELIAETTKEARVRTDAETIAHEARRMRQTVQELLNFGRSGPRINEPVEMAALVRELAAECEEKLENRGVRLTIQTEDNLPTVSGNEDKLRQVLEHLLNNSAQSIAAFAGNDTEREQEIRVSVSHDARSLQVIVSDTGPGFKEPGRVFDPLQVSQPNDDGAGVGLSICYGIVREHGGEINAFNLHPYGAAVVVELPLGETAGQNFSSITREVA